MKKLFLLLITCLSTALTFAQTKSIEFEPRVGTSLLTTFDGDMSVGYNLGGMAAFRLRINFILTRESLFLPPKCPAKMWQFCIYLFMLLTAFRYRKAACV